MGMEYLSCGRRVRHLRQHQSSQPKDNGCGVYVRMEEMYMMAGEPVCRAVMHTPGEGRCGIDGYHHSCIGDDNRVVVSVPTTGQPMGYAWIYIACATIHMHVQLNESGRD